MEGREAEGGGHQRLGAMPWLLVKEDRVCSGVSNIIIIIFANDFPQGRKAGLQGLCHYQTEVCNSRGEKDGDREMEVEETLREAEKLADEVEKDVMEE